MKKIALMLTLVVLGCSAIAQSLNVTSAFEADRRGYYDKAKKLIDPALEHDQTKNDAKTWYYAAHIYSQIGTESENPRSKYRNLDPDWLNKCKNAALRCKELDTDKEYTTQNNVIITFVGNAFYKNAINAFNAQNWDECMSLCEQSIQMYNESGEKKNFAEQSYLLAGKAAMNAQNNESIKKYFKALVRTGTTENLAYNTLFRIYKQEGDTNEAIKLAQRYVKSCKEDYKANLMMAEAFLMKGNNADGVAEIQKALERTQDKPELHAEVLAMAGAIYEHTNDFESAKNSYAASLEVLPNQYVANNGMGIVLFNHAMDKYEESNKLDPTDDAQYEKMQALQDEAKEIVRSSIPYFQNAINYIDGMPEAQRAQLRGSLFNALNALKTVYVRLEMYNESKPIQARIEALQAGN